MPQWAPDTGFLFAEPDTVFTLEQANKLGEYFKDYGADMSLRAKMHRLEELAETMTTTAEREEYGRILEQWKDLQAQSSAAAWPSTSRSSSSAGESTEPPSGASHGESTEPPFWTFDKVNVSAWVQKGSKVKWEDLEPRKISEAAEDITDTVNYGCRLGFKHFQWLGWSAEQYTHHSHRVRKAPKSGSHLLFVSAEGARKMMGLVPRMPDKHLAYILKEEILTEFRDIIKGGFVYPPLAYYYSHASTTNPGKFLSHHLDAGWAQPGTRRRPFVHTDIDRRFHRYEPPPRPCPQVGAPLSLPAQSQECRWITQLPPGFDSDASGWGGRHEGDRTLGDYNL